jgi:CheY-like chemotaxis protein
MATLVVKGAKAYTQREKRFCPAAYLSGGVLALVLLGLCLGPVRMLHAEPALGDSAQILNTGSRLNGDNSSTTPATAGSDGMDWQSKRLAKQMTAARPAPVALPSSINNSMKAFIYAFVAAAVCLLAASLIYLSRLAPPPVRLKASAPAPPPVEKDPMDPALTLLFRELSTGLSVPTPAEITVEDYGPVPLQMEKIAGLFGQINQAAETATRQKMLHELARAFSALKQTCNVPGLRVMGQCASLLQALLTQLAQKESEVTHSCLRTLAGGIDLLRKLAQAGKVEDNLVADPPVKVLAVDDNPVCLTAAAMALRNAFPGVDLAADGASCLPLAQSWSYDAIFLDVEMPGMDGFELCSKIHQTSRNEKTPVIFVTAHSDFDSRARSAVCGSHELIGKPFLALEISFKAFALIVGRRLEKAPEVATASSDCRTGILPVADTDANPASESNRVADARTGNGDVRQTDLPAAPEPEGAAQMFLNQAPDQLRSARFNLQMLAQAPDAEARGQILEQLRIDAQSLAAGAQGAKLNTPFQIAFALQALLSKLRERPACFTQSCSSTIAAALEALEELCWDHGNFTNPWTPPRILVVDDDPVALRAISVALQYNFGKPQVAESGEATLTLAEQQQFDVVFMDVRMPGMDGFAACSCLRRTSLNSNTPVAFVTSLDDEESRQQAILVRSSGFIVKPVLPSEIRLAAMTLALKGSPAQAVGALPGDFTLVTSSGGPGAKRF